MSTSTKPTHRAVLNDMGSAFNAVTDAISELRLGEAVTDLAVTRYRSPRPAWLADTVRVIATFGPTAKHPSTVNSVAALDRQLRAGIPAGTGVTLVQTSVTGPRELIVYLRPTAVDAVADQ